MEFTVDSRDVDLYGHCRPSALLGYLQEGATWAGLELGVSGPEIRAKYNGMWMVVRQWVELKAPLRWGQRVQLQTWHRGAAGASSYRDFLLCRDGQEVGRAVSTWVMVDVDSHRLVRMRGMAEMTGTDGGALCFDKQLHRVPLPRVFDQVTERRLGYSETDINGHINNTRYADYACDALRLE
jgi:acyl-CoA thioesterase FadM